MGGPIRDLIDKNEIQIFLFSVPEEDYSKTFLNVRKIWFEHNNEKIISDRTCQVADTVCDTMIATDITKEREINDNDVVFTDSYASYHSPFVCFYISHFKMIIMVTIQETIHDLGMIVEMTETDPRWEAAISNAIEILIEEEMIETEGPCYQETTMTTVDPIKMIMTHDQTVIGIMKDLETIPTTAIEETIEIINYHHFVSEIYKQILSISNISFFETPIIIRSFDNRIKLKPFLDVRTKYCWDSDDNYSITHTRQMQMQEVALHYELCVRPNSTDTTLTQYNSAAEWNDMNLFNEIFQCTIQPHVKAKVVTWLESAGCNPNVVKLRKQGGTDHVDPTKLLKTDMVESIEFTNILNSLVFQLQNTDRVPYENGKFLYLKTETWQVMCCQARPTIGNQITVVLPNLAEFKDMIKTCKDHFSGGAGDNGLAKPPIRHYYSIELDDLRKLHEESYLTSTKTSDVLKGAPIDHMFTYSDCETSDVMVTSKYLKANKKFAPPPTQQAKLDHVSETNKWKQDNFHGEHFMFTRQGKAFKLKRSGPIVHQCKSGRFGCPTNCRNRNKPDFAAIPTWSSAFASANSVDKHSIDDDNKAKLYKLFRQFKFDFIVKIMKIDSADKERKESPAVQQTSTTNSRQHQSLATLLSDKKEGGPANDDGNATEGSTADNLQDMVKIKVQVQRMLDESRKEKESVRKMFEKFAKDEDQKREDYEKKVNKNFGNMTQQLHESSNQTAGSLLDIINQVASDMKVQGQNWKSENFRHNWCICLRPIRNCVMLLLQTMKQLKPWT